MSAGPVLLVAVLMSSLDLSVMRSTSPGTVLSLVTVCGSVLATTIAVAVPALTATGESAFKCTGSVNVEGALK